MALCQYHHATVIAHRTVCSKLSYPYSFMLKLFLRLRPKTIYIWVEVGYKDPAYPTLPMYYSEKVILASVNDYSQWTREEIEEAHHSATERVRQEFIRKYSDKTEE